MHKKKMRVNWLIHMYHEEYAILHWPMMQYDERKSALRIHRFVPAEVDYFKRDKNQRKK